MNREKTALFLADCLSHMPEQPEQLQRAVDTVIAGLKRIADGQEWPRDESRAAVRAVAWAAVRAAKDVESFGVAYRATWAAADAAVGAATWTEDTAIDWYAARAVLRAAWAHPDLDAELKRQAQKQKELGL